MAPFFLPRGIRNNNPGNIRLSKTMWQGQKAPPQDDPDFVEFVSPLYGLRALMKLLLTYHLKYGLDTVESILNRFAPPHENDTGSYMNHVARMMKIKPRDTLNLTRKEALTALAQAIVVHENGKPPKGRPAVWYPPELYVEAAQLVLPVTV